MGYILYSSLCYYYITINLNSSHYLSLTSPYRYFYVTHVTQALQSHDLSGEGIKLWITYILFWPHKDMGASPDEWSAQCRATSEITQTWKTIHTKHTLSQTNKANMQWWLRRPNDIRGPWGPKVSWHLSYRWGKTPKKTSPRKPVPTGDRTRARCVTSAHATTFSTAVDISQLWLNKLICISDSNCYALTILATVFNILLHVLANIGSSSDGENCRWPN